MAEETHRPSKEEVQKYIDRAMKTLDESPDKLEKNERRMLIKVKNASTAVKKAVKDIQDLTNQITQAEARVRSLELQVENSQGYVNAYIDELVSMKFNLEDPVLIPPQPAPESPKNRKEKRAAKSKSNNQEATAE